MENNNQPSIQRGETFELTPERKMFSAPFSSDGRIRRLEFGLTVLIANILSMILGLIMGIVLVACGAGDAVDSPSTKLVFYIFMIPVYWFHFAQGAKRCHDRGNSGWYQLIPFYILWLIFAEGEPGSNEYGPNPKGE